MAGNYTLTIIKPDAFGAGNTGKIIAHLEQQGFKILAARVCHMSQTQAGEFYGVRFFLGIAQAGFFPGVLVYLTYWYRQQDRCRCTTPQA